MTNWKEKVYQTYLSGPAFGETDSRSMKIDYVRRNYIQLLPPDRQAQILDFGCGRGEFIEVLLNLGYTNVKGLEVSKEMFQYCKSILPGKVVLSQDGLSYLRANQERFDLIVMMDVLEHFEKAQVIEVLEIARASLRPKGRLLLQVPNGDAPFCNVHRYRDLTHEQCFSARSISQALLAAGFSRAEIYPLNLPLNTPVRLVQRACQITIFFSVWLLRVMVGTQNPEIITPCLIVESYR